MNRLTVILIGVGAAGVGFAGGYFLGSYLTKKKSDELIMQMNDEVNDLTNNLRSKEIYEYNKDGTPDTTNYKDAYINSLKPNERKMYEEAPNKEQFIIAHEKVKKSDEMKKEYFKKAMEYKTESNEIETEEPDGTAKIEQVDVYVPASKKTEPDFESDDFLDGTAEDFEKYTDENGERDEGFQSRKEAGIAEVDGYTPGSYDGNRPPANGGEDAEEWTGEARIYDPLPPYLIDETDFQSSQFEYFTKAEYTYFSDGTLLDEGDSIVPNPDDIIGYDNLAEFDRDGVGVILVRNEMTQTDYEVEYKEMTYKEFMGDV